MDPLLGPDAFKGSVCLICGALDQGDECADCRDQIDNGRAGHLSGRHYTTYTDEVRALKRAGDIEGAIGLLWKLFRCAEAEAGKTRQPWRGQIPPWYTEQLAICYRKMGRPDLEVRALDAYDGSPSNLTGPAFSHRRAKAEQLVGKMLGHI